MSGSISRLTVSIVALAAFALPVGVTAATASSPPRPKVYVYGDSLIAQSVSQLDFQLVLDGWDPTINAYGGTALCDWMSLIEQQVTAAKPNLVVLEFSGNAFTPCMHPPVTEASDIASYQVYLDVVADWLHTKGVPFLVVGAPPAIVANGDPVVVPTTWTVGELPGGYSPGDGAFNAMYQAKVAAYQALGWKASYTDAGQGVATTSGGWTYVLPCLSFETAADGCSNGLIEVRQPDFHHFCPSFAADGSCAVWDSGAWRYAGAITQSIVNPS